jgi:hypothetical protein
LVARNPYLACLLLTMTTIACAASREVEILEGASRGHVVREDWLDPPPGQRASLFDRSEIPKTSWLEVAPTRLESALQDLTGAPWVSLRPGEAHFYGADHLRCPDGQFTYLARGVYTFAETGDFTVMQDGSDLLVSHSALGGSPNEYHRAAILVCLPAPPSRVFVSAGVAQ